MMKQPQPWRPGYPPMPSPGAAKRQREHAYSATLLTETLVRDPDTGTLRLKVRRQHLDMTEEADGNE